MRLLLIRHGETVHNVSGVYAGTTDSPLTNHGILQAQRLGSHLFATGFKIVKLFSSDLQRAYLTANAIREYQISDPASLTKLHILREQDFGCYEGKFFPERSRNHNKSSQDAHQDAQRGYKDIESKESMRLRMETFLDEHLLEVIKQVREDETVAVVAHGIILNHLWRSLLGRFPPRFVSVTPELQAAGPGFSLEYNCTWSNTGYMDLEIRQNQVAYLIDSSMPEQSSSRLLARELNVTRSSAPPDYPQSSTCEIFSTMVMGNPTVTDILATSGSNRLLPKFLNMFVVVKAANSRVHLQGLKKTRGGIGSLKYNSNQRTMDSFFKK